jgi:hypothetical protein
MIASSALGVTWVWLLLIGGVGGAPAAGAPLPLDPTLSAIAPDECLWYSATAGLGAADPASGNQTEQLFAEPQVQRLMNEVQTQVMAAIRRMSGPNREQRVLAAEAPKIVKALLTRPVAAYVEDVQPGPSGSVKAEGAFVLNAGDGREELAGAIKELLALAGPEKLKITAESANGVEWQHVATPPEAPQVRFGWKDNYLVIAIGENTPKMIVDRMSGAAPAWLTKLRAEHPIDREMSIGYVNVAGILQRVKPLVTAKNPQAWPIVEQLGLTNISAVHAVSGFDKLGFATMAHIVTDGQRPGLLAFLPYQPLAADDLAIVPKDALVALAYRINAAEVMNKGVALASQFEPRAKEDFEKGLWEVESHIGVNVREDVLAALGDAWVAYVPGGDLMSCWLNSAVAVRVKDAAKLRQSVAKVVELARGEMARHNEHATIVDSTVDGRTIYSIQFQGEPIPFSPSWCVSDDWAVFGLLPPAVQAALDRKPEDSLAKSDSAAAALADGAAGFVYQDTPQLVRSAYPFVQMGVQMMSAQLRQVGVTIDTTALPSAETVIKHLRPTISTMSHGDDGFHFISRGSVPGGGNVVGAAPVVAALLLPAVGKARERAREAAEMSNLKQLSLAMLSYESATNKLPTDITGPDGKPLMSWRVRLLPYMEEQGLYAQFHMDEPWDSEHNLPLLDQVPQVLRSPSSEYLGNRTRILALKGDDTLFPMTKELGIRNITDGTSNTLSFVEASPEAAVEWTRPADIDFNGSKPFAGVAQPSGSFLAAFCDGHVQRLSLGIGRENMKALATREGGEAVGYDAIDVEPAPWLYATESEASSTVPAESPTP